MNLTKIARFISYVTGPEIWFSVLLTMGIVKSGLTIQQIVIITPLLILFQLLIPLGLFHFFIQTKRVSGWDLNLKQDRMTLAPIGVMAIGAGLLITYYFGNYKIFDLAVISYVVILIIGFINRYWKISIHATLCTLGTISINYLYNWHIPWLFLVIPVVLWARYQLKKHDIFQVIGGFVLTAIVVFIGLYVFGLLS